MRPSTVFKEAGKWWFWDEAESTKCGPWHSQKEAEYMLNGYIKHLCMNAKLNASDS